MNKKWNYISERKPENVIGKESTIIAVSTVEDGGYKWWNKIYRYRDFWFTVTRDVHPPNSHDANLPPTLLFPPLPSLPLEVGPLKFS